MLPMALAVLQLIVSARAGFVDIVNGEANVRQYQYIPVGQIIRTGAFGHVELTLGWNAFLRLDENSAAILESADRADVAVRLESGSGLVEVNDINKGDRIVVTSGTLKTTIDSKGVFKFDQDAVSVLTGRVKHFNNSGDVT